MLNLLWTVPALPLAGYVVLSLAGRRLPRAAVAAIGAGSVGLAALVAIWIGIDFIAAPPSGYFYRQVLWTWIDVAGFTPRVAFHLDALSLVMVLVATVVGFLIHLYSTEYMLAGHGDSEPALSPASRREEKSKEQSAEHSAVEGYSRFFAYMNLFVASMCILLLADNLLLFYLGWEGVGLCSYLLIGFWYRDPANGLAARKAFVVTRVGDAALAVGLFLLFTQLGTLDIPLLMQRAAQQWPAGSSPAIAAAALLLGGALGKSAQLPLQTWLPDAMAGPTPVSALIHAATMVTAGVYLIARTHILFSLAPPVQFAVAVIGALTLLIAGFSALAQHDIKRVLAYSTISQIGYMFLALGVGAWSAAIFHFMTHAFFKALLFLGAGAVIVSLHDQQNIFRMGGLRRRLPVVFWTFVAGSASLAALPLVTAGFFSKDQILWLAWSSPLGNPWLWAAGWAGALVTGLYIFRLVFLVFFGAEKSSPGKPPALRMTAPLIVLAALSIAGGWLELPPYLGDLTLFSGLVQSALPPMPGHHGAASVELVFALLSALASLGGIGLAYLLYLRHPQALDRFAASAPVTALRNFWRAGWGFDTLYDRLFVQPYQWLARIDRDDFVDAIYRGMAALCRLGNRGLSATQNGQLRNYAAGIAAGSIIVVFIAVLT